MALYFFQSFPFFDIQQSKHFLETFPFSQHLISHSFEPLNFRQTNEFEESRPPRSLPPTKGVISEAQRIHYFTFLLSHSVYFFSSFFNVFLQLWRNFYMSTPHVQAVYFFSFPLSRGSLWRVRKARTSIKQRPYSKSTMHPYIHLNVVILIHYTLSVYCSP